MFVRGLTILQICLLAMQLIALPSRLVTAALIEAKTSSSLEIEFSELEEDSPHTSCDSFFATGDVEYHRSSHHSVDASHMWQHPPSCSTLDSCSSRAPPRIG